MQVHRIKYLSILYLTLVAAVVTGCSTHPDSAPNAPSPFAKVDSVTLDSEAQANSETSFRLVVASNVNGEIDPCGCAVNPKGGLDRRLNFMRSLPTAAPAAPGPMLALDAGNALFANESIPPSYKNKQLQKAALILKVHAMMGVKHQNVGHLDLSAGLGFLKSEAEKNGIQLVSANLADAKGQLLFAPSTTVDLGKNVKITVIGLTLGFEGAENTSGNEAIKALDAETALRTELAKVPLGRPVVVLSDLGSHQDQLLFAKIDRPIVVIGSRDLSSTDTPLFMGASMYVEGQMQGMQWGVLDVVMKKGATRWYDISAGKRFALGWNSRVSELQELEQTRGTAAVDSGSDAATIRTAQQELLAYAPKSLEAKNLTDYRTYEMTAEFAKPNEVSALMKQVSAAR